MPEADLAPMEGDIDRDQVRRIVDDAIGRYAAARRERIEPFVDRNFSFGSSLALHRRAVGWDMVRAPVNLSLALPHLAVRAGAAGSRRLGAEKLADWLDRRRIFFPSDVAREIEWRVFSEFLELPYAQIDGDGRERRFLRDALAEEIFRDPRIHAMLEETLLAVGRRADDPEFRDWLTEAMATYAGSRVAAGDLATALLTAGVGALAFKQLTPGMLTLGPTVAHAMAQHAAVASFPLGSGVGGLWYGLMPAAGSTAFVAGVTGGMMAMAAVLAAFSGILTDPLQRRLGLHQKRLRRMVDGLEAELHGHGPGRFTVRDHYAARIFDLLDVLRAAYRVASP